jgi:predicted metal-dependent peptidase
MGSLTASQVLVTGRIIAKRAAPYFRQMLHSFETRPAPGLGTVGVTKRGIALYDPAWVETLTPAQMGGLWLHECLHRVLKHMERQGTRDPKMYNRAGDLAINPSVIDMGLELPDGDNAGLFPEKFGWKRGLTADEYYDLLRKLAQEQAAKGSQKCDGGGDGSEASGDGDGGGEDADHDNPGGGSPDKPHAGGGWCGSCAGRPVPGEPEDQGGGKGDGRSDAELDRINRQTAEAIQEHASKGRGNMPASLKRWAEGFLQPPKIPWRAKLARLVRSACAWRPGAVDHRWDGPGRRQAGLGYGPGRPVMPRLRAPVPRVAIAVDTSGSMGTQEIIDALRESRGVLTAVGAEVDFVSCDAQVHGLGKVTRIEDVAKLLKGGGGTDFNPVFEALEKRRPRPEVLIFLTDGCGPAPELPPSWCKTIWVLVGPYKQRPVAWGEAIEVDNEKTCKTSESD